MAQRLVMTDGTYTKSVNPWDVDSNPEAWNWYSNAPRSVQSEYYAKVAAMNAAFNLTADTIGNLPFAILDKSGKEYDTSDDYQNKVGFLPNPSEILRLAVLSYIATNTIYQLRTSDAIGYKVKGLYHAVPTTFKPVLNGKQNGVEYIERTIGANVERYKFPEDKNLIRMWRLDHTTELLPSPNTEAQAIASSAEIIYFADFWIGNFFKRGGIKPTLIAMKGLIDPDTKKDQEKSWSNWLKGVGKQFGSIARIFNAQEIDPKVIGAGVDDLKDNNIYRQALENIAIGRRMPLSLLLSNSANRATATEEKATWINNSLMPLANWIAYEWNTQLFKPIGLFWAFRPEMLDEQQEDEVSRASSVNTFMDFLMKSPSYEVFIGTAETFGYELSESLVQAADKYFKDKKANEAIVAEQMKPEPKEDVVDKPEDEYQTRTFKYRMTNEMMEDATVLHNKWIPTLDQLEELRVWRGVAITKFNKGGNKALVFDYEPHHGGLPEFVSLAIKSKLEVCQTAEDIKAVFDMSFWMPDTKMLFAPEVKANSDILALAESLNKLAESMKPVE